MISFPLGVPPDLQSGVKKCPNLFRLCGFAIRSKGVCFFLLLGDYKSPGTPSGLMTHLLLLSMSFLVSQTVVVLVDIMLRLTLYYEPYAREYKDGGNRLHTLEYGETYDDTHGD